MGESRPSSPRPTPKNRDNRRIAGFAAHELVVFVAPVPVGSVFGEVCGLDLMAAGSARRAICTFFRVNDEATSILSDIKGIVETYAALRVSELCQARARQKGRAGQQSTGLTTAHLK